MNIDRDVNHIHSEIRQLRNQKFLLTTASLTIFSVVTAWLLQTDLSPSGTKDVGLARFALEFLLLIILFVLFYWLRRLQNLIVILATYLKVRKLSDWEDDYYKYTKKDYVSQTKLSTIVFVVLGALSLLSCLLSCISLQWDEKAKLAVGIIIMFFIVYVILLLGMGFFGWFFSHEQVEHRWNKIIKEKEKAAP